MTMLSSLNGKLILAFAVILSALVGYFAVMERYTEGFDVMTGSFGDCLSAQTGNADSMELVRDRSTFFGSAEAGRGAAGTPHDGRSR